MSDQEARLRCMHGAADILFTGENRYLSEPSLFPHEYALTGHGRRGVSNSRGLEQFSGQECCAAFHPYTLDSCRLHAVVHRATRCFLLSLQL